MGDLTTGASNLGTLLWIGQPSSDEFQPAFHYCISTAAQVALRVDLEEALRRPAAGVRCGVLTRSTRDELPPLALARLSSLYPDASLITLMGTLCEGMAASDERNSMVGRVYWHRWNQVIPRWLGPCGADPPPQPRARSVAVLSSSYAGGGPLLELAESTGATAVWCRGPDPSRVRNVDAVWWDDSVAPPVSQEAWRNRIRTFGVGSRRPRHAWIVNSPRLDQHRAATAAGLDLIVSKPYHNEVLERMLGGYKQPITHQHCELKAA